MTFLDDNKRIFEKPLKVQLDITNKCNLDCLYCYNKSNYFSSQKELTDTKLYLIAKKIIKEINPVVLSLSGGEPLLKKNLLYKILKLATKNDIETWLTTNALLLDEITATNLKKYGLKKIFTNIDSIIPETHDRLRGKKGAFVRSLNNLEHSKNIFGLENITITSVITKYNYKDLESMVNFLHKNGFSRLKLLDMIPIDQNSISDTLNHDQWLAFYSNYKLSLEKAKSAGVAITPCHAILFLGQDYLKMRQPFCMAGRLNMVVLATGEILPCNHLKYKEFSCGNALTDNLLEVWNNSPILNKFRYDLESYRTCSNCSRFTKCAGGCKAMSYAYTQNAFQKDPYCETYQLNKGDYEKK